jgi:heptosyltransferase-3
MSQAPLPPPEAVRNILIWHQGALGDLLLAGPALVAISRHYPRALLTGVGVPERWGLLSGALPLAGIWDSSGAVWAYLFADAPLPALLAAKLAPFQLALVFTPEIRPGLLARLREAGIGAVRWVPSFPVECRESLAALQARHLGGCGLGYEPEPFRLALGKNGGGGEAAELLGSGPWVVAAPGSGHPCKNWPLAHYYEVTRALAWECRAQVAWLAGPAEREMLPYLQALAVSQGQRLWANLRLAQVAGLLSRSDLYLGGDSGITHLAAAVSRGAVLALFGPTDPAIWAPWGSRVTVLTAPCPRAPCSRGREIPCLEPQCLGDLPPARVLAVAAALLSGK